jgi:phenylpropionate dioxygenase-like ring-hydroxylating dioxygenase large terminal subunit
MRNEIAQPIIRTMLDHMADGRSWTTTPSSVPASDYTDPAHLDEERATLFSHRPQVVALSPDLPELGSVLTRDTLGVPVVLTRDQQGVVHAFANVCAHRGAQVAADGRRCSRRLTCPYHAWSYDLNGSLVGVPDRQSFPEVTIPGPGLRPMPVREQHGLIWLVPQPGLTDAIDPELGAFGDDLDSFGIDGYRWWRSHRFDLELNWKLVVDTFLEPYHFASLHRDTVGPLFVANLCHAERTGPHVREVLPRRTLVELASQPPESWDLVPHSALVYVLFPNTVFVMQIDHIETWRVAPHATDPSRSICDLDFYIPHAELTESSERHWDRNWQLTINTVLGEDFAAMARVQRGLNSGAIEALRVGANEPALGLFHAALRDALPIHR